MGVSDKSQRQEAIKATSQRRLRLKVAFPSDSDGAKSNLTPKMFIIVYLIFLLNTKTSFRESPAEVKIVRNERLSSDPSKLIRGRCERGQNVDRRADTSGTGRRINGQSSNELFFVVLLTRFVVLAPRNIESAC